MPPVGQIFTDDQIASVLTYIRREWGQDGSPVEPATVNAVRAATKGRSRPWTDAELTALGRGSGGSGVRGFRRLGLGGRASLSW